MKFSTDSCCKNVLNLTFLSFGEPEDLTFRGEEIRVACHYFHFCSLLLLRSVASRREAADHFCNSITISIA